MTEMSLYLKNKFQLGEKMQKNLVFTVKRQYIYVFKRLAKASVEKF